MSGAVGTGGAREGSPSTDLAAGGLYSKTMPCGQGLQGNSTGGAGRAKPWSPWGCKDAAGKSPCLKE